MRAGVRVILAILARQGTGGNGGRVPKRLVSAFRRDASVCLAITVDLHVLPFPRPVLPRLGGKVAGMCEVTAARDAPVHPRRC